MARSDVIRLVLSRLTDLGIPFAVTGSFASSIWGRPRMTDDLDLVVVLTAEHADPIIESFTRDFSVMSEHLRQILRSSEPDRSFSMVHMDEAFKVDCMLLNDRPFDQEAFSRRVVADLGPISAPCLSPEDMVLQKLLWYAAGNRVSDKQWGDIMGILEARMGKLDVEYMQRWASSLDIADLLEDAFGEAALVDDADAPTGLGERIIPDQRSEDRR